MKSFKNYGGKGYSIKKLDEVQQVMRTAMHDKETKPTLIGAYVDPFEPIMPPKAKPEFLQKMSKTFERGQPGFEVSISVVRIYDILKYHSSDNVG
ncbi:MAG: hypothetical protein WA667_06545 [Candidatus Nitrosopolaris sp.]